MKAKLYIGILSALLLAASPVKAQFAANSNYRYDGAGIVINNYYDDYDYYFSSRINRFHRSYAAFEYYSPVFTDTYWYNYQPYSWGVSIYGRSGFGYGYSVNYPVYYNAWDYNRGYDPYYGSTYYWGYDPFYYSWYSPVVININIGSRWRNNYWGWHSQNHWYNDYRPVYNTNHYYHNYHATRYSSREYREYYDNNKSSGYNRTSSGNAGRRETGEQSTRTDMNRNNERMQSGNTSSQERRSKEAGDTGSDNRNNGNNGSNANNGNNNNSRPDGNNGNFGRNSSNSGNSGNNRNSRPDGNNGNFGQNSSNIGNSGNNRNSSIDGNKGNVRTSRSTVQRQSAPSKTSSGTEVRTRQVSSSSSRSSATSPGKSSTSRSSGSTSEKSSSSSGKKERSRR